MGTQGSALGLSVEQDLFALSVSPVSRLPYFLMENK